MWLLHPPLMYVCDFCLSNWFLVWVFTKFCWSRRWNKKHAYIHQAGPSNNNKWISKIDMLRFQMMVSNLSQGVIKNLTDHFQNISNEPWPSYLSGYVNMLQVKIDRLAKKIRFVEKNTFSSYFCTPWGWTAWPYWNLVV